MLTNKRKSISKNRLVGIGCGLALLAGCTAGNADELSVRTVESTPIESTTTSTVPQPEVDLVAVQNFLDEWKASEWKAAYSYAESIVTVQQPTTTVPSKPRVNSNTTTTVTKSPSSGGGGGGCAIPAYICQRESGGSYTAVNPSSGAGGKYQFLPSTWHALGGKGLPQNASPAEQDAMAAKLWAGGKGCSHWSAC